MIHYLIGDATSPQGDGKKIIAHICNDIGRWGRGFVVALSKRWSDPEKEYRSLSKYVLGTVQFVEVEKGLYVVNMIAQHGIDTVNGIPPIRYEALRASLREANNIALLFGASIHMPRIGCGLAGGSWAEIETIINETVFVDVYVYDRGTNSVLNQCTALEQ